MNAQTTPEEIKACKQETCPAFCKDVGLSGRSEGQCVAECRKSCAEAPPPDTPPITVTPKYLIMAIAYAPPGCTTGGTSQCGSGGASVVDYNSSSSNGTKISNKDSFQLGLTISYDNDNILPGGINGGGSYSFSETTSDTQSVNVTKSQSFDWRVPANGDGIDHGQDQVLLLLHPKVTMKKSEGQILWRVTDGGSMFQVYVSELRNPCTMRTGTAKVLLESGLTYDDYQSILSEDPFGGKVLNISPRECATLGSTVAANGGTFTTGGPSGISLDSHRFWYTGMSFPYQPTKTSSACNGGVCNCSSITGALTNDRVSEDIHEDEGQTTVELYGGIKVPEVYSLKVDTKMVWTNTATTDNTTEGKQTATATVSCPSAQYAGDEGMYLWWDSRYGSFVFLPYDPGIVPMIHKGSVVDRSGHAIGGQLVSMTLLGKTYRTYSAPDGTYHFPSWNGNKNLSGTAQIVTGGVKQTVQIGRSHVFEHPIVLRMR